MCVCVCVCVYKNTLLLFAYYVCSNTPKKGKNDFSTYKYFCLSHSMCIVFFFLKFSSSFVCVFFLLILIHKIFCQFSFFIRIQICVYADHRAHKFYSIIPLFFRLVFLYFYYRELMGNYINILHNFI